MNTRTKFYCWLIGKLEHRKMTLQEIGAAELQRGAQPREVKNIGANSVNDSSRDAGNQIDVERDLQLVAFERLNQLANRVRRPVGARAHGVRRVQNCANAHEAFCHP